MNKTLLSSAIAAVCLFIFSGCQKARENPTPEQSHKTILSFSSTKPQTRNATRTMYDDSTTKWSPKGEKIKMAYKLGHKWENETQPNAPVELYPSAEADVSPDGTTATFTVETDLPQIAPDELQFYAVYPAAITTNTTLPNAPEVPVTLPATQSPTTDTYDDAADLLVAKAPRTYTGELPSESIGLDYTRLVAHNTITLKGLPFLSGETVTSVTFIAPAGRAMAGSANVDFETQTAAPSASSNNAITLNYNNIQLNQAGNLPVWFCSLPFTVAEGEIFTVQVVSSRGTYTRDVTAPVEWNFMRNYHNTLAINMSVADFVAPSIEGDYIVLALENGVYYALSSANGGKGLGCETFAYDGSATTVTNNDATLAWTIVDAGDGTYTMQNDGRYLTGENGNKASTETTPYPLTITENGDGSYTVASAQDPTLLLSSDNNKTCFAFYSANRNAELYLVPIAAN